jgi:hypothetical protein
LRLGTICHSWRQTVINTSSLWRLDQLPKLTKTGVRGWIERAGPGTIDLVLPWACGLYWFVYLSSLTTRIKRLHIYGSYCFLLGSFDSLTSLHIHDEPLHHISYLRSSLPFFVSRLNSRLHPTLRVLSINSSHDYPIEEPIPTPCATVRELVLNTYGLKIWKTTLVAYSPYLRSLNVHLIDFTSSCISLDLPNLIYLKVSMVYGSYALSIHSPVLFMVYAMREALMWLIRPGLSTSHVTTLIHTGHWRVPLELFPALVRIFVSHTPVYRILLRLIDNPPECKSLKTLVVAEEPTGDDVWFLDILKRSREEVDIIVGSEESVASPWLGSYILPRYM